MLFKRAFKGRRHPQIAIDVLAQNLASSSLVAPLMTSLLALIAYVVTLENDISWVFWGGDGGELIAASYTLGIPHPPGYPTYVLLGKLFSMIPIGTTAYRYNLFSAVAMSAAAGFVAAIVARPHQVVNGTQRKTMANTVACVACGLAFALSPIVWQQSVVAEVYALNALLLIVLMWALMSQQHPLLIGILFGLSLTTQLNSLLFIPLLILLVPRRSWLWLILGSALGLLPFLALPFLYQNGSAVSWGEPDSLEGWWWLVSGRLYRPNVFALPLGQWLTRLHDWGVVVLAPLIILFFSSAAGLFLAKSGSLRRRAIFLLATALLATAYALTYNTFDSVVYLIPVFLVLSINLGLLLPRWNVVAMLVAFSMLLVSLPLMVAPRESEVRTLAYELFERIPGKAIVLTPGDQSVAALWYFQQVEGSRPDLIIVDENMFQFDWYRRRLRQIHPTLTALAEDDVPKFVEYNSQTRPLCRISLLSQHSDVSCTKLP